MGNTKEKKTEKRVVRKQLSLKQSTVDKAKELIPILGEKSFNGLVETLIEYAHEAAKGKNG